MESQVLDALLKGGPFAVVLALVLAGQLYTKGHVNELREVLAECRANERHSREELAKLQEVTREIMVPAITKSTDLVQRISDELWRRREVA